MDRIRIRGKIPLCGELKVQGSKNAALPLMAASILHPGRTAIRNCPRILDVECMSSVLRELGCSVSRVDGTLVIDAAQAENFRVAARYAARFRASVLLMGSLLGRFGRAYLPYPGGCTIGARPIDLHLKIFRQMGAVLQPDAGGIFLLAPQGRLCGCAAKLDFPSVGATENAVLGAVLAQGETVLENCAREPEVAELCRFLNGRGARIEGVGGSTLTITGVDSLQDAEHELLCDRIVAGTYLLAAAGTRGQVCLYGVEEESLKPLADILRADGVRIESAGKRIALDASGASPAGRLVRTAPYPGFPTDLQSQMLVYLLTAGGTGRIEENLFESRFQIAGELAKMGADIVIQGSSAQVRGPADLRGAEVAARELRGGAALTAAGLLAAGETVLRGSRFIKRGYEDICRDLACLGADIREA